MKKKKVLKYLVDSAKWQNEMIQKYLGNNRGDETGNDDPPPPPPDDN